MMNCRLVAFVPSPHAARLTRLRATVLTAAALALATAALLPAQAQAKAPKAKALKAKVGPPTKSIAWTAEILYPVAARSAPRPRARVKTKLMHFTAYSRRRQVLLVTGTAKEKNGRNWIRVHLPTRPNGNQGWVPADAVQLRSTGVRIRVSIARRVLEVWRNGKRVRTIKVAVGAPGTPTTTGLFAVADPVASNGQLGPQIIVLTAYSRVYKTFLGGPGVHAIHGWGDRGAFGRAVSNGCVRMDRSTVAAIAKIAKPGTPVQITAN